MIGIIPRIKIRELGNERVRVIFIVVKILRGCSRRATDDEFGIARKNGTREIRVRGKSVFVRVFVSRRRGTKAIA